MWFFIEIEIFQWKGIIEKFHEPFSQLKNFTQMLLLPLLLKCLVWKEDGGKQGKQKHIHLMRSVISYLPSIWTWNMFCEPNQKKKCTKHNCLLPWFKCFSSSASCLALLYLLRLSEQKKRTLQFKINILLWDKLCLLNLPRLELVAPATTCAWQLPYNSPWHNLHFPEG